MRVVAIGGGHGLASTLRAVKRYASDITAIVSVADDGGSSGRLRQALGIPAPGDLRRCLVALAGEGTLWAETFEHRFGAGELDGHAVGNLVIAGLAATTADFETALAEAGRLLQITGRVLPATCDPVVLKAAVLDAEGEPGEVHGQVAVGNTRRIVAVSHVPGDPEAPPAALDAIAHADQLVIGPGSLFTSVLAAAAVPAIRDAIAKSPARRVYVCNLREQHPETTGYDVCAHVDALVAHGVEVDVVLADDEGLATGSDDPSIPIIRRPLANAGRSAHDPARLATALTDLVG